MNSQYWDQYVTGPQSAQSIWDARRPLSIYLLSIYSTSLRQLAQCSCPGPANLLGSLSWSWLSESSHLGRMCLVDVPNLLTWLLIYILSLLLSVLVLANSLAQIQSIFRITCFQSVKCMYHLALSGSVLSDHYQLFSCTELVVRVIPLIEESLLQEWEIFCNWPEMGLNISKYRISY